MFEREFRSLRGISLFYQPPDLVLLTPCYVNKIITVVSQLYSSIVLRHFSHLHSYILSSFNATIATANDRLLVARNSKNCATSPITSQGDALAASRPLAGINEHCAISLPSHIRIFTKRNSKQAAETQDSSNSFNDWPGVPVSEQCATSRYPFTGFETKTFNRVCHKNWSNALHQQ